MFRTPSPGPQDMLDLNLLWIYAGLTQLFRDCRHVWLRPVLEGAVDANGSVQEVVVLRTYMGLPPCNLSSLVGLHKTIGIEISERSLPVMATEMSLHDKSMIRGPALKAKRPPIREGHAVGVRLHRGAFPDGHGILAQINQVVTEIGRPVLCVGREYPFTVGGTVSTVRF